MQRQTAVTAYLKTKQLLLFVFARIAVIATIGYWHSHSVLYKVRLFNVACA